MRIFVISMTSATERRAKAARQLAGLNLDFEFFDAVERVADAFRYFDAFDRRLYKLNTGRSPLAGEIGCFASHKALWQTCVELDEPIIVFEDDFQLGSDFLPALAEVELLAKTFGFIRLQSYHRAYRRFQLGPRSDSSVRVAHSLERPLRYLTDVPLCLVAYAISPVSAAALVENSNVLGAPVDKYMQKTWQHTTPIFALEQPVVATSAHAVTSTIGDRQQKCRNVFFLLRRLLYKGAGAFLRGRFNRMQLGRIRARDFVAEIVYPFVADANFITGDTEHEQDKQYKTPVCHIDLAVVPGVDDAGIRIG